MGASMMLRCRVLWLIGVSCLIGIVPGWTADVANGSEGGRWSPERAWEWYGQRPLPVGFNYVVSTAVNTTEMWQAETFDPATIDREFRMAGELGFNTCRIFMPYIVWEADPQGFLQRMETFLDLADCHGITIMFTHFDDCAFSGKQPYLGKQDDPVPGVHNSGWTPSPGYHLVKDQQTWPKLKKYVQETIAPFADDPRVLVWDLYNEPSNGEIGNESLPLLQAAFTWAREVNPSQPLTTGLWNENEALNKILLKNADVISFHAYDDPVGVMHKLDTFFKEGRPLFCTEYLRRQGGNTFQNLLPIFIREKVACYHWGLVNGKTQTHNPWGSQPGAPEPSPWQHDLFRNDGTPYDGEELEFIRQQLWTPLFNGQNLDGWEVSGLARWSVWQGVLSGIQGPNRESGDLLTKNDYDNFILTATYRIDWPANSGIWFRYQNADKAFQADILEYQNPVAWSGSLYCTGKMFIGVNEDPSIVDREGWNTMTVLAKDDRLVVHLNGHKTVDVRDDTSDTGKIGIQIHAGDEFVTMRIQIRDMRIRPM